MSKHSGPDDDRKQSPAPKPMAPKVAPKLTLRPTKAERAARMRADKMVIKRMRKR